MSAETIRSYTWLGRDELHLDNPNINIYGSMIIGCYGGNSSAGAIKNEDAVWCLSSNDWQLGMIFDAHNSSDSVVYLVQLFNTLQPQIEQIMRQKFEYAFPKLQQFLLEILSEQKFRDVQGETSVLICAHKDGFLWWFCIGDNLVCVLHPELIKLGQCALNQRSFYEWVGEVNTFDLPIACYSLGIRELRQGKNYIIMTTDGLLECGSRYFDNPTYFYNHFTQQTNLSYSVQSALKSVHTEHGKDSATIIAWVVENKRDVSYPTS